MLKRILSMKWFLLRLPSCHLKFLSSCISVWICLLLTLPVFCSAETIYIPDDYSTIQAGIDASNPGDIVIVRDGTYIGDGNKNLNFFGKDIVVSSENGAEYTIIDCKHNGRGFTFENRETHLAVVSGFTIQNGYKPQYTDSGGAILCDYSSPTIKDNIIRDNYSFNGGGILLKTSEAYIVNNQFTGNKCYEDGGAISITDSSNTYIKNNLFSDNKYEGN